MTEKHIIEDMLPLDIADSLEELVNLRSESFYAQGELYEETELDELSRRKVGEQAMLQF